MADKRPGKMTGFSRRGKEWMETNIVLLWLLTIGAGTVAAFALARHETSQRRVPPAIKQGSVDPTTQKTTYTTFGGPPTQITQTFTITNGEAVGWNPTKAQTLLPYKTPAWEVAVPSASHLSDISLLFRFSGADVESAINQIKGATHVLITMVVNLFLYPGFQFATPTANTAFGALMSLVTDTTTPKLPLGFAPGEGQIRQDAIAYSFQTHFVFSSTMAVESLQISPSAGYTGFYGGFGSGGTAFYENMTPASDVASLPAADPAFSMTSTLTIAPFVYSGNPYIPPSS